MWACYKYIADIILVRVTALSAATPAVSRTMSHALSFCYAIWRSPCATVAMELWRRCNALSMGMLWSPTQGTGVRFYTGTESCRNEIKTWEQITWLTGEVWNCWNSRTRKHVQFFIDCSDAGGFQMKFISVKFPHRFSKNVTVRAWPLEACNCWNPGLHPWQSVLAVTSART